jgi:hypothetical protein
MSGTRSDTLVGVKGFEPSTPASRKQCSTKLSYTPNFLVTDLVTIANQVRAGIVIT